MIVGTLLATRNFVSERLLASQIGQVRFSECGPTSGHPFSRGQHRVGFFVSGLLRIALDKKAQHASWNPKITRRLDRPTNSIWFLHFEPRWVLLHFKSNL